MAKFTRRLVLIGGGVADDLLFQFALERRTRREAADSAAARQGEATQLSFLMRSGITTSSQSSAPSKGRSATWTSSISSSVVENISFSQFK